jgi:hypothetical protein
MARGSATGSAPWVSSAGTRGPRVTGQHLPGPWCGGRGSRDHSGQRDARERRNDTGSATWAAWRVRGGTRWRTRQAGRAGARDRRDALAHATGEAALARATGGAALG